jgi:hypothetical protein
LLNLKKTNKEVSRMKQKFENEKQKNLFLVVGG